MTSWHAAGAIAHVGGRGGVAAAFGTLRSDRIKESCRSSGDLRLPKRSTVHEKRQSAMSEQCADCSVDVENRRLPFQGLLDCVPTSRSGKTCALRHAAVGSCKANQGELNRTALPLRRVLCWPLMNCRIGRTLAATPDLALHRLAHSRLLIYPQGNGQSVIT